MNVRNRGEGESVQNEEEGHGGNWTRIVGGLAFAGQESVKKPLQDSTHVAENPGKCLSVNGKEGVLTGIFFVFGVCVCVCEERC